MSRTSKQRRDARRRRRPPASRPNRIGATALRAQNLMMWLPDARRVMDDEGSATQAAELLAGAMVRLADHVESDALTRVAAVWAIDTVLGQPTDDGYRLVPQALDPDTLAAYVPLAREVLGNLIDRTEQRLLDDLDQVACAFDMNTPSGLAGLLAAIDAAHAGWPDDPR